MPRQLPEFVAQIINFLRQELQRDFNLIALVTPRRQFGFDAVDIVEPAGECGERPPIGRCGSDIGQRLLEVLVLGLKGVTSGSAGPAAPGDALSRHRITPGNTPGSDFSETAGWWHPTLTNMSPESGSSVG